MTARNAPKYITAIALVQAGFIAGMLANGTRIPSMDTPAYGQIIQDPAAQQIQTNELLKAIDAKLSKISSSIDGELKVRIVESKQQAPVARPQQPR